MNRESNQSLSSTRDNPSFGVVIPHYNDSAYLFQAIECCSLDGHPDRIIVVDDGSDREEFEKVCAYAESFRSNDGPSLKVVRKNENTGVINTLNEGLSLMDTDFVMFRAADDRTLRGHLKSSKTLAQKYPDAGLVAGDIQYVSGEEEKGPIESLALGSEGYYKPESLISELSATRIIHSATVWFNRRHLEGMGGFLPITDLYHDWWACHLLALKHGLLYTATAGAEFRLRSDSVSSQVYQDISRAQLSLKGIESEFSKLPRYIQKRFESSGLMGFFNSLRIVGMGGSDIHSDTRTSGGIERVVQQRLTELKGGLYAFVGRVFLYGKGNHSQIVFSQWQHSGFPSFSGVLQSQTDQTEEWNELPVMTLTNARLNRNDLIVLSSKSFETEMAHHCMELPDPPKMISFWTPSLTSAF